MQNFFAPLARWSGISVLYDAVLMPLLRAALACAALFVPKIRERQRGVQYMWRVLRELPAKDERTLRLWFHAASLGEFEQLKPIIEHIRAAEQQKSAHNAHKKSIHIVVSFFSPSGYRYQARYPLADTVVYLPVDTRSNARRFVRLLDADAGVIARYDVWHNILRQCTLQTPHVPLFLVCATLNEHSPIMRWKPVREWFCAMYNSFHTIYTAGTSETAKFIGLGVATRIETAADTRFDRIAALVNTIRSNHQVQIHGSPSSSTDAPNSPLPQNWFASNAFVIVLGSSWQPDENIVIPAFARLYKEYNDICPVRIVIAPHEPNADNVRRITHKLQTALDTSDTTTCEPTSVLLSMVEHGIINEAQWGKNIVVDSIGKLLYLYSYASVAFVGGGYGAGVHSVSEPAGHGVPLASGHRIERARDALILQQQGALTVIHTSEDCYQWLRTMLTQPNERTRLGTISSLHIHSNIGWSRRIADDVLRSALDRNNLKRQA